MHVLNENILWYALECKVSSIFTRTIRMMFSLSFVAPGRGGEGGEEGGSICLRLNKKGDCYIELNLTF